MAMKKANVTARIQPKIKEQAEAVLGRIGIPVPVRREDRHRDRSCILLYRQRKRNRKK